jgi:hypothetical protein
VDPLEQLESCQTLFLIGLCEPSENRLQVLVQEARTQFENPKEVVIAGVNLGIAHPITPDGTARYFQLDWAAYIAYQILDEGYSKLLEGEVFTGRNLRSFAESSFLKYLAQTSHASSEYPGTLHHYELVSQMHILDVVAQTPPEITLLSRKEVESKGTPVCRVAFPR